MMALHISFALGCLSGAAACYLGQLYLSARTMRRRIRQEEATEFMARE